MNILELLGLEKLLGEDFDFGVGYFLFIPLMIIGFFGWIYLAIFHSQMIDQGAMVFNLLAFIIILIINLIRLYKGFKNNEILKGFVIVSLLAIVISFFIGITRIYHSIPYNYEYNHFCSGIAYTFVPNLIIGLLIPIFTKGNKISKKIASSFGSIGSALAIIVVVFIIGQGVTAFLGLFGKGEIYNNFATYRNISYNENRKDMGNKTLDEFLQDEYFKVKEIFNERCINDNNSDCDKFIKDNYVRWLNEYVKKPYGYEIGYSKEISDSEAIIKVFDREYDKECCNYKLNFSDFSLTKITYDEFDELYKSN